MDRRHTVASESFIILTTPHHFSVDIKASSLHPAILLSNLPLPFTVPICKKCMAHPHGWLQCPGSYFKGSSGGSMMPSGTASGITTSAGATHPGLLPLCHKEEITAQSPWAGPVSPTLYVDLHSALESLWSANDSSTEADYCNNSSSPDRRGPALITNTKCKPQVIPLKPVE